MRFLPCGGASSSTACVGGLTSVYERKWVTFNLQVLLLISVLPRKVFNWVSHLLNRVAVS